MKYLLIYMMLAKSVAGQDEKIATPFYDDGKLMYNVPFTPEEIKELRMTTVEIEQCTNNSKSLADQLKDSQFISAKKDTIIDTLKYVGLQKDSIISRDSSHFVAFKDEIGLWQQIDSMNTDYIGQLTWQKNAYKVSTYGGLVAVAILVAKMLLH